MEERLTTNRSGIGSRYPALVYVKAFDVVLLIGGINAMLSAKDIYCSHNTYVHSLSANEWKSIPQRMNMGRAAHGGCVVGNYVYVICGKNRSGLLNSFERLDVDAVRGNKDIKWELINPKFLNFMPRARTSPIVCHLEDDNTSKVMILGGQNKANKKLSTFETFDYA